MVFSIKRGDTRDVLVPTGFARLDDQSCTVYLDFVTALDIERLPSFTGLPINDDQTAWLEQVLTREAPTTLGVAKVVRRSDDTGNAS